MDKERFWHEQLSQVNKEYLFGGSTIYPKKGLFGSHAYTVLQTWQEGDLKLLQLRNPWLVNDIFLSHVGVALFLSTMLTSGRGKFEWEGDWSDGSNLWTAAMMEKLEHKFGNDGVFWITYKDFLKYFSTINRVRLFSEDWQVSQCWTCVNVPWALDFLDTTFTIDITEKCPVVIVLSQLDDRYFNALRGRYWYTLHFRVYKDGDYVEGESNGKWIVRSMHASGAEVS